jgi:hypothetical protein
MIKSHGSYAYELAEAVQKAANETIDNYDANGGPGAHKWEDDITSGFIQAVTGIDYTRRDIPDKFSITPDRYQGNIESKTGADLAILYDVEFSEYSLQTAILIQAKRQGTSHYKDFSKAREQCSKMLSYTTDSFIFDYSEEEMCAVPAVSVAGTKDSAFQNSTKYPERYHKKGMKGLFQELFMGYIGNEHTYHAIWSETMKSSTPRRTSPIYTDGGEDYEEFEGENGTHILSIRVTGELNEE